MPLTAEQVSKLLPSRPLISSGFQGPQDVVIERYRHPPGGIDVPASVNALLVVHLKGPIAVEEKRAQASWVRKWTDKGQVSLSPPGTPVMRRFKSEPEILLLQISPGLITSVFSEAYGKLDSQLELIPCFAEADPMLDTYARLLATEVETPQPGFSLMLEVLGRAIALRLLRGHSNLAQTAPDTRVRISPIRLQRVLDYLHDAPLAGSSLAELASVAGLSQTHFSRAFRATLGVSPHKYVVDLRMQQARKLLAGSRMPVAEIAHLCGFGQASSFATAFRKSVGVAPRTWRADRYG